MPQEDWNQFKEIDEIKCIELHNLIKRDFLACKLYWKSFQFCEMFENLCCFTWKHKGNLRYRNGLNYKAIEDVTQKRIE